MQVSAMTSSFLVSNHSVTARNHRSAVVDFYEKGFNNNLMATNLRVLCDWLEAVTA